MIVMIVIVTWKDNLIKEWKWLCHNKISWSTQIENENEKWKMLSSCEMWW